MLTKVGPWDKFQRFLNPALLNKAMTRAGSRATKISGLFLVRAIRKQMTSVSGPALSPITIQRKGSSKPLFDRGDLFNAITVIPLSPLQSFVGVPEGPKARGKDIALAAIATVLEGGQIGEIPKDTVIKPKRAKALFIPLKRNLGRIRKLKRGVHFVMAKSVRIKPRPFVGPAIKNSEPMIVVIYEREVKREISKMLRI